MLPRSLAVVMKSTWLRSNGMSRKWSLKVLFCSGSSASNRAAAGSPRKSPASLSISSSSIRGFELLAVIMALMILPGMAPM